MVRTRTRRAMRVLMVLVLSCACVRSSEHSGPVSPPPNVAYRFDRLFVLPVYSLGDLRKARPAARQSLVLAFSDRADSLVLLREDSAEVVTAEEKESGIPSVRPDTLYTARCDFELVRRRLSAEQHDHVRPADTYALCADVGYRRRPSASSPTQMATAVGKIWSGRLDSVIWHDSSSVVAHLEKSELAPDTIASLITRAVIRLRERLP